MKQENKKYKVGYGSTSQPFDGERGVSVLNICGYRIVELFESYESWNSQYRSKECMESRESIKKSIFETLYNIDKTLFIQRGIYQNLIDQGIHKEQIEYDEDEIDKYIEEIWSYRNRKSFQGRHVLWKDKDSKGNYEEITKNDVEYVSNRVFYGYIDDEEILPDEDYNCYYDKIDQEEMVDMIMEELMNSTDFVGTSSDDSLDKLRDFVNDEVYYLLRKDVK